MSSIELRPSLVQQLETEATRRHTSVEALANDWLEEQLWEEQHRQIRAEVERYQAQFPQLRAQYANRVIAMRDGQVVEVGDDLGEVYRRVQERYGNQAVLITRVGGQPIETHMMRRVA